MAGDTRRTLTGAELEQELDRPCWRRSTGLAGGAHYRDGCRHLVVKLEQGRPVGRMHVDRLDPQTNPVGHLLVDAGPLLAGLVVAGSLAGVMLAARRR